jgi:hypothetical protein
MFNGTIGQHVRHALDHFAGAINAGEAPIEYDKRSRGTTIETSRTDAISTIDGLCRTLSGLEGRDKPVTIRVMLSSGGDETELPSTQSREVFFATHHAFHHHAMMASIAGTLGVEAPAGFGKAPATINNEGACSTSEKA